MALGLIGTGILTIPILTGSAAYSVAEMLNWKCGLGEKLPPLRNSIWSWRPARLGALAINFFGMNPMKALFGQQ